MKVMSIDLGDVRTGVAVSDVTGFLAGRSVSITQRDRDKLLEEIMAMIEKEKPGEIVLGLPINMDGSEGPRANKCRKFAAALEAQLEGSIPVVFWDERSTTVQAHRNLLEADLHGKKQRERIDSEAAAIILDSYLRYRKNLREREAAEEQA